MDDVLIDAPYAITEEMIQSLHISVVVCGTVAHSNRSNNNKSKNTCTSSDSSDAEGVPERYARTGAKNGTQCVVYV